MQYDSITSERELLDFCTFLIDAPVIAFDTEFVSEHTYRPDLCLIQVAAAGRLAVIDTVAVKNLDPFWERLIAPGHETIAHAGREEVRFCLHAAGQPPHNLFDVQLAAGLIGLEYPASYGTLIHRLLGKRLGKGETRTDWRRRPLSSRQIEYALQDVLDLENLRSVLHKKLSELGRLDWMQCEMQAWLENIQEMETQERWQRVAGISGLSLRGLAIVRELWRWREAEAKNRNRNPKRILRDDLIAELAKRQTSDVKRIRAVRGMERSELQQHLPKLAACVERALNLSESELPAITKASSLSHLTVVGQFLNTALGCICRDAQVAPSLVGTVQDVRELTAHHLGMKYTSGGPPVLTQGWRAEVVGRKIEELLDGKLALAIGNPRSAEPLEIEQRVPRG